MSDDGRELMRIMRAQAKDIAAIRAVIVPKPLTPPTTGPVDAVPKTLTDAEETTLRRSTGGPIADTICGTTVERLRTRRHDGGRASEDGRRADPKAIAEYEFSVSEMCQTIGHRRSRNPPGREALGGSNPSPSATKSLSRTAS